MRAKRAVRTRDLNSDNHMSDFAEKDSVSVHTVRSDSSLCVFSSCAVCGLEISKGWRQKRRDLRGSKVLLSSKKRTTLAKQPSHHTEISTQKTAQDTYVDERYGLLRMRYLLRQRRQLTILKMFSPNRKTGRRAH